MKKSIIIILAVVAILVIWAVSVYNGLVTMDENVSGQWANVETQYQRRADLIPNLVNTVKGYATHEKETLEGVVAARSQATQIKVDAADLTPEKLAQYQKAQGAVTSALGKLLAITENYPDLKANQNFLELQAQLEGTENRINVARKNFNDAAQAYNTNIRRFPKNIFAGMFGFDKKAYFEAEEGSVTVYTAPTDLHKAIVALRESGVEEFQVTELEMIPQSEVELSGEDLETFEKLYSVLEDDEDVQKIYTNVDGF